MEVEPNGIAEWLAVFKEAALNLTTTSLRFDDRVAPLPRAAAAEPQPSVYIAILSPGESIHLGLSTTQDGVRALVRALLRVRADRPIDDPDAVDGLGELLNVVAGKVKSRMADHDGALLLGLPMFMSGRAQPGADMEQAGEDIRLGPVPCRLTVYRRARGTLRAA